MSRDYCYLQYGEFIIYFMLVFVVCMFVDFFWFIFCRSSAKSILTNKRYSVKWCVPVVEVEVLDVGSGITVNIDNKTTTTITYTHPGMFAF